MEDPFAIGRIGIGDGRDVLYDGKNCNLIYAWKRSSIKEKQITQIFAAPCNDRCTPADKDIKNNLVILQIERFQFLRHPVSPIFLSNFDYYGIIINGRPSQDCHIDMYDIRVFAFAIFL